MELGCMGMHKFRELLVWHRAMNLVVEIYSLTAAFPSNEKYGLVTQLRRSAVSIASNIAEGAGRASNFQFRYFLQISMGSCNELQTQIELGYRVGYIKREISDKLSEEILQIYKMILSLYNSLKTGIHN